MEEVADSQSGQQLFIDVSTRLREIEERQHLLRDRMVIVSRGVIEIKEKVSGEMREMREVLTKLQKENSALKETINLIAEKMNTTARQEQINILQRQLDLLRGENGNS